MQKGPSPVPVWHIITKMELGGAQEHTLHVVNNLDRRLFSPALLCGKGGTLLADASYTLGSRVSIIPSLSRQIDMQKDSKTLWRLVKLFREQLAKDPRLIVHTHSSKAGILGRAAAAIARVPIVFHTIHGYGFHQHQNYGARKFYVNLERLAAKATDHFIAVSNEDINIGIANGLFDINDVSLVRSGFDLKKFTYDAQARSQVRRVLGIPEHAPVAGTIANFKPQKGPLDFVDAMLRVGQRLENAHFIYTGDGELRQAAENRIREFGYGERFHIIGWRRDVARILSALDCYVLTSHWEGLPKTIPQAMSVGLPVVATAVNGTPEVVDHGRTGYLVEIGDIENIAKRTSHLLLNKNLSHQMGSLASERVSEFDQDIMLQKHEKLYFQHMKRQLARSEDVFQQVPSNPN